jgi:two-component system sporulation sensor kinase A
MEHTLQDSIELIPFPTLIGKDGFFVYANQLAVSLFQAEDVTEIIGTCASDFAHPEYLREIIKDMDLGQQRKGRAFNQKKILTLKKNILNIESSLIPFEINGENLDYVVIKSYTDLSDIKAKYTMHQKYYQTLIDNSIDTVAIVTNCIFKYINKAGMHLLGAKHENEILGKSFLNFLSSAYHHDFITKSTEILSTQEITMKNEWEMLSLNGDIRYIESVIMPFMMEDKPSLQVIIRDITEHKKSLEHTIQSEKLLSVGQLSAGIAHEIRNPLTSIKGLLQLLDNRFLESDTLFLDIIKDEIDKIERITGEMLSLAKPQAIIYNINNMITLVKEVVILMDSQASMKNIDIQLVFDGKEDDYFCNCDKSRIKQVFINLIKNAIDAMHSSGTITIHVYCDQKQNISVDITDEGCGIPARLIESIKEPFFTTKGTGSGLGLTICYKIVKEHQGEIDVKSIENEGTTFTIKLPSLSKKPH